MPLVGRAKKSSANIEELRHWSIGIFGLEIRALGLEMEISRS
jgi:hypothetical protein